MLFFQGICGGGGGGLRGISTVGGVRHLECPSIIHYAGFPNTVTLEMLLVCQVDHATMIF